MNILVGKIYIVIYYLQECSFLKLSYKTLIKIFTLEGMGQSRLFTFARYEAK